MSDIETIHEKQDGEQITKRVVTLTDAVGEESVYEFEVTVDGYEFLGDGDPSDDAEEALDEWAAEHGGEDA